MTDREQKAAAKAFVKSDDRCVSGFYAYLLENAEQPH